MRTAVFHETFSAEERLCDSATSRAWATAFLLALFSLPLWAGDYVMAMACIVGIHVIATLGLNLTTGNAGLISLSHGAFLGVGCYAVAWLAKLGVPFFFALPLAGLLAAALGVLVGLPSLRVKGIYLAVATLAAHFILAFVFREWDSVTGGVPGTNIPRASLFGFVFIGDRRNFVLIFACALLAAIAARNLARTYIGRAFVAVRERDFSAELLGVHLLRTKLLAFAIGAFYAGVAGGLLGYFYGAITPWLRPSSVAWGTIMTSSTSLASVVADPAAVPQHIVPGPTYPRLHEILMEYIARTYSGGAKKPNIAYVYSDTEFGRDGIPAGKARAEKLGLPIVAEIVTKQSGIDVAPEVAKLRRARPDIVIFQGYILAPMPEFVRQLREAGLNPQIMGTAWGLDKPAYDALGALGVNLVGASMYRYGHETDSDMINNMRDHLARNRPEVKHLSPFYVSTWLSGMVFAEIAERCIKANKPLTLPNMKAALESMKQWDSGGIFGALADLSSHQIPVGRIYAYDPAKKAMEPASPWIKV